MSTRAWFQIVLGCLLGCVLCGVLMFGLLEMADWIVEKTHEPYSYPIPNGRASCWTDGEAIAVVPPDVAQVVRL